MILGPCNFDEILIGLTRLTRKLAANPPAVCRGELSGWPPGASGRLLCLAWDAGLPPGPPRSRSAHSLARWLALARSRCCSPPCGEQVRLRAGTERPWRAHLGVRVERCRAVHWLSISAGPSAPRCCSALGSRGEKGGTINCSSAAPGVRLGVWATESAGVAL